MKRESPRTKRPITVPTAASASAPSCAISGTDRGGFKTKRANNHHAQREAAEISERKKSIIGILGNVAELGASRMEETIGSATLRDAAIGTGIALDKMIALTGQAPVVAVQVNMPTAEERAARDEEHRKLDEIAQLLRDKQAAKQLEN